MPGGGTLSADTDTVLDRTFRYVVVEGPIGVGKTTLARRLAASLGSELLLEAPEENPFLPRFYENPSAYGLSTQLFFLLQRARQLEELHQADLFRPLRVADFFMEKDRLFARLTLDRDEFALYEQVYTRVIETIPTPDLVIYLQAPVNVLRERIAGRGISYERAIDSEYLHRLVEAYMRFFYDYDAAPLLIVNATQIDFAHRDEDYNALVERLKTLKTGRHFFNPLPF